MTGNGECDRMKTSKIGQSAAEPREPGKVQRLSREGVGPEWDRSARCKKRWARNFDSCIVCGTKLLKHSAFGKCFRCYDRGRQKERDLKRALDPIKREQGRLQSLAWKDRNKVKVNSDAKCYYHENRDYVLRQKNESNHGGNYWKVLERDNFTCQRCGDSPVYFVHHKDPGNHDAELQITMCVRCHISIHHQKLLSAEDRKFFSCNDIVSPAWKHAELLRKRQKRKSVLG